MLQKSLVAEIRDASDLDALYVHTDRIGLTPGWVKREVPINLREPKSKYLPAHWDYTLCAAALDAAGRLIDVALAERRNLLLRNPVPGNNFATTNTLVCAYQMILPGEKAPCHRHSPHALRVIIDGRGSYSTVNGERTPMETGDIVLTPGTFWHSHGHDGDKPAYWLDGLDVPLVHLLEAMSFEDPHVREEAPERVVETSPFRFSADSIRRGLDAQKRVEGSTRGPFVRLEAPDMPTMGLFVQRLYGGEKTRASRSTADRVFSVMEGAGTTRIAEKNFTWKRGDTLAVPSSVWFTHEAATDSVLFELTNEPLMRFAKLFTEVLA